MYFDKILAPLFSTFFSASGLPFSVANKFLVKKQIFQLEISDRPEVAPAPVLR